MTADQITIVKDEYEPLILRTMNTWREALIERGYGVSTADETHDECYRWSVAVYADPDAMSGADAEPIADVSVTLAESGPYDRSRDDNGDSVGVNVIMNVVSFGGRILGGFSPYNYTDHVWTDDLSEIAERMQALSDIDGNQIVDSIAGKGE